MPSRTFVVLVSLGGVTDSLDATVRHALDEGVSTLVVVDSRHESAALQMAASHSAAGGSVAVAGVRRRHLTWVRGRVAKLGTQVVDRIAFFVYRMFRFIAHRAVSTESATDQILQRGQVAQSLIRRAGDVIMGRVVDKAVMVAGAAVTKPAELAAITRRVSALVQTDVVLGIICLDSPSLLPGWLLSRRFRGLPVLTAYPTDWDARAVDIARRMSGGSST